MTVIAVARVHGVAGGRAQLLELLRRTAAAARAEPGCRSYDVADIEYFLCKKIFPTGVLAPLDTKKIKNYDKIVPIFTTGKLTPEMLRDVLRTAAVAAGLSPVTS